MSAFTQCCGWYVAQVLAEVLRTYTLMADAIRKNTPPEMMAKVLQVRRAPSCRCRLVPGLCARNQRATADLA